MTDTLTPSRLWKKMTPAQRLAAARAFWLDEQATDDQVQAIAFIADKKKFRTRTLLGLDVDRRAHHLASLLLPDPLAARALITYHLAEQRPMMGAFLDALGIAHEEGLIQDDAVKPDPQKIGAAVEKLAAEYPSESVALYLNTLLCQDPETWSALEAVPQREPAA